MTRKISLIIVTVGAALALVVPAAAQSSRNNGVRPKIQPQPYNVGQQPTWRAGDHLMY